MTGVQRYAYEIVSAIDILIGERHPLAESIRVEVLCPEGGPLSSPFVNVPLRILPRATGHIWEQAVLPLRIRSALLSLCNTGPIVLKRQILCIHDANTWLAPESYGRTFRTGTRILQPALARQVARVTTVSAFSRDALVRLGIAPKGKIDVIHDGHEHALRWDATRSRFREIDFPRPFVLLVGSKAPHKNVGIIYRVAGALNASGIDVYVTGGQNKMLYAQERLGELPENMRHLGKVDDDDLAWLYRHALCLAFPSRTEGFGLPPLEAMALGCPVISSDAASLPEVCGNAAIYAAPGDPTAWLKALERIASDAGARKRLVTSGFQQAKLFSWREGALKYLVAMAEVDKVDRHFVTQKGVNGDEPTPVIGVKVIAQPSGEKRNAG
jgi:glycosyltransferase involved in cell wall biosynthesis